MLLPSFDISFGLKFTKGPHGSALGPFVRFGSFMRHELKKKGFWTFMFSIQIVRLNVLL